jgi:choline kinase
MDRNSPGRPRRAIILAAGDGGRLAGAGGAMPKPLVPVAGRPIIEYTLDAAGGAGIEDVLVVTGYRDDDVRDELATRPRPFGLSFVHNPEYARGASYSLRAARSFAREAPSLLLMSDHLLGAGLLRALIETHASLPAAASLVAADGCERDPLYTDEATKLVLADGPFPREVTEIGKELAHWDALDCGAFILDPAAWDTIDSAPADCELSTIFQALAGSGELLAADASGQPWYDVDTPADLIAASQWLAEHHGEYAFGFEG